MKRLDLSRKHPTIIMDMTVFNISYLGNLRVKYRHSNTFIGKF